jgi:3-hydroxyisobutyrate dehydrogenase-like beta-hydroxyacid dehydrogenase
MNKRAVGFVGLGRMGFGMASNLVKAGVPLTVFDVNPAPMAALAEEGASTATDPADLASKAQYLFLCLPSEKEVADILDGSQGLLSQAARGLVIVDATTMNHGAALQLSEQCETAGIPYSDCPISGMPFRASNGTLTMMFGGSAERFAQARPYLEIMGEFIVHCGDVGMGQLMKAVNNIIYNVNIAALCEVMPLAVKAGLGVDTLEQVLTTASARSFASEYFVPRILAGKFEGDFSLQAAFKDIVNIQEAAARYEASMPVVEAMVSTYRTAIDMGLGDEPKSAMIKVYERQLDQEVRKRDRGLGCRVRQS